MSIEVDAIGLRIFAQFRDGAKDVWDTWSPAVRQLAEECALDAGKLAVLAAGGKDVSAEVAHINAQLANLKVNATLTASKALWSIAQDVLKSAISALLRV